MARQDSFYGIVSVAADGSAATPHWICKIIALFTYGNDRLVVNGRDESEKIIAAEQAKIGAFSQRRIRVEQAST